MGNSRAQTEQAQVKGPKYSDRAMNIDSLLEHSTRTIDQPRQRTRNSENQETRNDTNEHQREGPTERPEIHHPKTTPRRNTPKTEKVRTLLYCFKPQGRRRRRRRRLGRQVNRVTPET